MREFRQANPNAAEPVVVELAGGGYTLTRTLELNELDAATEQSPTVFRAAEGEEVRISGGRMIPAVAAKPVDDPAVLSRIISEDARPHILQLDLRAQGITDYGKMQARGFRRPYIPAPLELFVDDQPLHLARYPNVGAMKIGEVLQTGSVPRNGDFADLGGKFKYTDDRHALWTRAEDLWLSGLWNVGYADDTIKVAQIDPEAKTVTMAQATMYGIATGRPFRAYYALNLLEEIDEPGEWYVDRDRGLLYFYPPTGFSADSSRLGVSLLEEPMVALEGASYVRFENLTFECSRGMGVYIERGTSDLIGGCTFRNLGIVAVCIGKGT